MVQYVHTPWRDRAELLKVRQQFYPTPPALAVPATVHHHQPLAASEDAAAAAANLTDRHPWLALGDDSALQQQQQAVSRVSMWMQRGSCPHMVESTALLAAAILSDVSQTRVTGNASSYATRAAYSAAFSRFVTGLLDGHQDKQRKLSMYSIAKNIGLPATFVELRHQATHEQLPSLSKLRSAARKALSWIWDYYWKHLTDEDQSIGSGKASVARDLVSNYLEETNAESRTKLERQLKQLSDAVLLQALAAVGEASDSPRILLKTLQMSREILDRRQAQIDEMDTSSAVDQDAQRDLDRVKADLERSRHEVDTLEGETPDIPGSGGQNVAIEGSGSQKGWARYEGTWTPKPIGIV